MPNPDLKWETTDQYNIGLDIGLFDDRLSFTSDYYNKTVKDLLLDVPQPEFTGTTFQLQNVGEVENKGFEIGIQTSPVVSKDSDGFNWDLSINVSTNKNEVTKLFGDVDLIIFGDRFKTFNSSSTQFAEDGSFIRLKNLSLGYNFDSAKLEKIGISKVRVYISGQNLITITDYIGYDPELSGSRNNNQTFSAGSQRSPDNSRGIDWGSYPNLIKEK